MLSLTIPPNVCPKQDQELVEPKSIAMLLEQTPFNKAIRMHTAMIPSSFPLHLLLSAYLIRRMGTLSVMVSV